MSQNKQHGLGDAPIEDKYHSLDEWFNGNAKGNYRKVGFCLMVFNFGDGPGRANYISNASRADVVTLLKEQLARFAGQAESKEGKA
jgi:hypothetical protein